MYKSRVFLVGIIFFVAVVGVGSIALLPALFWSFVKEKTAEEKLIVVSQIVSTEERKNIRERVSDTNQKIALLTGDEEKTIMVWEAILKSIARKNPDISLTAFYYENLPVSTTGKKMTISGVSENRQTLLAFVNDLKRETAFADVIVPVSNFVRNINIPFSVSVVFTHDAATE